MLTGCQHVEAACSLAVKTGAVQTLKLIDRLGSETKFGLRKLNSMSSPFWSVIVHALSYSLYCYKSNSNQKNTFLLIRPNWDLFVCKVPRYQGAHRSFLLKGEKYCSWSLCCCEFKCRLAPCTTRILLFLHFSLLHYFWHLVLLALCTTSIQTALLAPSGKPLNSKWWWKQI